MEHREHGEIEEAAIVAFCAWKNVPNDDVAARAEWERLAETHPATREAWLRVAERFLEPLPVYEIGNDNKMTLKP